MPVLVEDGSERRFVSVTTFREDGTVICQWPAKNCNVHIIDKKPDAGLLSLKVNDDEANSVHVLARGLSVGMLQRGDATFVGGICI